MIAVFNAHEAQVKAVIPAVNLLVHQAKEEWPPLCAFLGVPVPETPYPRTHSKDEFFVSMQKTDDM